jgi:hypothetical protein
LVDPLFTPGRHTSPPKRESNYEGKEVNFMTRFIVVLTAAVLIMGLLALPASARGGEFAPKKDAKVAEEVPKEPKEEKKEADEKPKKEMPKGAKTSGGSSLVTANVGVIGMVLLVGSGMLAHRLVRLNS